MTSIDFLQKELDKNIERHDDESTRHKNMFRNYKYGIYILTALSGIFAAIVAASDKIKSMFILDYDLQLIISISIVIISVAISFINSLDGLRKPGELWIQERQLYYALKDLKRELEFELKLAEEKAEMDKFNAKEYFDKMQSILASAGDKWGRTVSKKKE